MGSKSEPSSPKLNRPVLSPDPAKNENYNGATVIAEQGPEDHGTAPASTTRNLDNMKNQDANDQNQQNQNQNQLSEPPLPLDDSIDDDMKQLLMSWYWAGYYHGLHVGKNQSNKT